MRACVHGGSVHLNGFPTVELSLLNLNHSCSSSWRLMVGAMLHTQPSCTLSAKFRFVRLPVLSTTLVSSDHSATMQHFQMLLDATGSHSSSPLVSPILVVSEGFCLHSSGEPESLGIPPTQQLWFPVAILQQCNIFK